MTIRPPRVPGRRRASSLSFPQDSAVSSARSAFGAVAQPALPGRQSSLPRSAPTSPGSRSRDLHELGGNASARHLRRARHRAGHGLSGLHGAGPGARRTSAAEKQQDLKTRYTVS